VDGCLPGARRRETTRRLAEVIVVRDGGNNYKGPPIRKLLRPVPPAAPEAAAGLRPGAEPGGHDLGLPGARPSGQLRARAREAPELISHGAPDGAQGLPWPDAVALARVETDLS
jgi:hypothetical protein